MANPLVMKNQAQLTGHDFHLLALEEVMKLVALEQIDEYAHCVSIVKATWLQQIKPEIYKMILL